MKKSAGFVKGQKFKYSFFRPLNAILKYHNSGVAKKFCSEYSKLLNDYMYSPQKTDHISLKDSDSDVLAKPGIAYVRYKLQNKSILREAGDLEIKQSNLMIMGGLDFDTPMHMSALIKRFEEIREFGNNSGKCLPIAIAPEVGKKERYDAALAYDKNPEYFPKYIEDRVKKYILPKITDKSSIFNPYPSISLGGFSIANREIGMMGNALKAILRTSEYNLNDKELIDIFSSFKTLNIGYAIDPISIKPIDFKKFIVFSLDDSGVLRPKALQNIIDYADFKDKYYHISVLPNQNGVDHCLLLLNHGVTPAEIQNKRIENDHGLPQYVEGIKKLPIPIKQDITSFLTFTPKDDHDFNSNDAEIIILGDQISS